MRLEAMGAIANPENALPAKSEHNEGGGIADLGENGGEVFQSLSSQPMSAMYS